MVKEIKKHSDLRAFCLISIITFLMFYQLNNVYAQNYTFDKAVKLSDNINSNAEESMPFLSPDGTKLYFVRTFHDDNVGGKYSGQDIWRSIKDQFGQWEPASNDFPELNNNRNNAVIGINGDESAVYLTNGYSNITTTILGIARSIKIADYFSKPNDVNIAGLDSRNSLIGFYINKTEDVLLISMDKRNSVGKEDLYICLKAEDGTWSAPDNLGATINTTGFEISPFLSDDGKSLFFASNGRDGFGDADIYMSRKLYDSWGIWSEPINLGPEINTKGFDAFFYLYQDDMAYFSSNRDGGLSNIYISKVAAFEQQKEVADLDVNRFKLTETEIQELLGMPVSRNIYFSFGAYNVEASSIELIDFLASKLQTKRQFNIELIGHTDKEGTDEFNQELSEDRANEVAKYFENYGIDSLRISTIGVGETQPYVAEGTKEELAKNRRVEINFVQ